MEVPFQDINLTPSQNTFNKAMSEVCLTPEGVFKEIISRFATVVNKRELKLSETPSGLLQLSSIILCNLCNSIHPI